MGLQHTHLVGDEDLGPFPAPSVSDPPRNGSRVSYADNQGPLALQHESRWRHGRQSNKTTSVSCCRFAAADAALRTRQARQKRDA